MKAAPRGETTSARTLTPPAEPVRPQAPVARPEAAGATSAGAEPARGATARSVSDATAAVPASAGADASSRLTPPPPAPAPASSRNAADAVNTVAHAPGAADRHGSMNGAVASNAARPSVNGASSSAAPPPGPSSNAARPTAPASAAAMHSGGAASARPLTPPAPAPAVRTTNLARDESAGGVLPPEPPHSAETELAPPVRFDDQRFFAPEDPPGGCATGECLPGEEQEFKLAMPSMQATASQDRWRQAVDRVREKSTRHGTSLSFGRLVYLKAGAVGIAYAADAGFHKSIVMTGTGRQTVEAALSEFFGEPTKLVLEEAPELTARAAVSLAEQDQQSRAAHERSTEAKVRTHAAVRAVMKVLGGELEHIQVIEKEAPRPQAIVAVPDVPEDVS